VRAGQRRHGRDCALRSSGFEEPGRDDSPGRGRAAGLTIVGPELPLSLGIVDALQERGLRVFGPTRAAAMLETSKGFAKRFLQRHKIPTANYVVCGSADEVEKAVEFFHPPLWSRLMGCTPAKA